MNHVLAKLNDDVKNGVNIETNFEGLNDQIDYRPHMVHDVRPVVSKPVKYPKNTESDLIEEMERLGLLNEVPMAGDSESPELMSEEEMKLEARTLGDLSGMNLLDVKPAFLRVQPHLMEVSNAELRWINEDDAACILWDNSVGREKEEIEGKESLYIRDLIAIAFSGSLNPTQQQVLASALKENPNLIDGLSLTPTKFIELVENCPMVAVECLLPLLERNEAAQYLSALVGMDMSVHSMEVVNRLTTAVNLPADFIHLYISNCISSCENIKDKYMQVMVKADCLF